MTSNTRVRGLRRVSRSSGIKELAIFKQSTRPWLLPPTAPRDMEELRTQGTSGVVGQMYDDTPFIVLTETKFSFRCIPVWDHYSPYRTRVLKKNTCDNVLKTDIPCARVGREDEGVSSNRPELGAVVLALQSVGLNEDALLLCDNEAVLCVIRKWVGQGGKATLATAPDADILREIIDETKRHKTMSA
jgi:hypothetical protein